MSSTPETTPPAAAAPLAGGVPDRTPAASPAGVPPFPCCEHCAHANGYIHNEPCAVEGCPDA